MFFPNLEAGDSNNLEIVSCNDHSDMMFVQIHTGSLRWMDG